MSLFKIYHNPECSKSREALNILVDHKKEILIINYLEIPLERSELEEICKKLKCKISDLIRVQGPVFESLKLDLNNLDQLYDAIIKNPILLQRPIVIHEDRAVVGRPVENIMALL